MSLEFTPLYFRIRKSHRACMDICNMIVNNRTFMI